MDKNLQQKFMEYYLLRSASQLHSDPLIPVTFPPMTFIFLRRLVSNQDNSRIDLLDFLLTDGWLWNEELIRILLPQQYHNLVEQLEEIQESKEQAIVEQDFHIARELRDAGNVIKLQMTSVVAEPVKAEPAHIIQALRNLGFQQSIGI